MLENENQLILCITLTRHFILVTSSAILSKHSFDLVALVFVTINIHVALINKPAAFKDLAE